MHLTLRSALTRVTPIEAAGLDAARVQELVTARRRHRHRTAMIVHDLLTQLHQQDRLGVLRGLRIRDRVLTKLMTDHEPLVRSVAVRLAGYSGNQRWAAALVQAADHDRDGFVRMRAVEALGNLRAGEGLATVVGAARDRAHPGCYQAVRALGQLLPASSGDLLAIAFDHEEPPLRRLAAETIARCADAVLWTRFVAAATEARSAAVRVAIVEGLGRSRAARAGAPVVRALAHDPSPEVRVAAADALVALRDPDAVTALSECALHDPFATPIAGPTPGAVGYPVREAAADALVAFGARDHV